MIKKTFAKSIQFFQRMYRLPQRKHFKSQFHGANIGRRNEPDATNAYFSDTPAIGGAVKMAQILVESKTLVKDVYPTMTESQTPCTLEHNIKDRGAVDTIISHDTMAAIGPRIKAISELDAVKNYQSEPNHQHQNYAEKRVGTLKDDNNHAMDRSGAPGNLWPLALIFLCILLNLTSNHILGNINPLNAILGLHPDISMFQAFSFNEPVLYNADSKYPSESIELSGRFTAFELCSGDAMTFKILTDDTKRIIIRSPVRSRDTVKDPNLRLSPAGGELDSHPVSKTIKNCIYEKDGNEHRVEDLPPDDEVHYGPLKPDDLVGRSFLLEPDENGQRLRPNIVRKIITFNEETDNIHFLCHVPESKLDHLRDYHDLLENLDPQSFKEDSEDFFHLVSDTAHQGPLTPKDPEFMGSAWNTLINREDGSNTYKPLHIIGKDMPDMCAQYAHDNNLLSLPGWKQFKRRATDNKTLARTVNQHKKRHKRYAPAIMYGVEITRDWDNVRQLDKEKGNTKWADSMQLEIKELYEYEFAKDRGILEASDPTQKGYTKIRCHKTDAVKHDGRHKPRFVAGAHLTNETEESVYNSVVSLQSLRIIILTAKLNRLELYQADVGSAYLETLTGELIHLIAVKEFAHLDMEGHVMIFHKVLYDL
jgi:hypothetical protein